MTDSVPTVDNPGPVFVHLTATWKSGPSSMEINIQFSAPNLEDALRKIKYASPDGAPLFRNPDSPEEDR